MCVVVLAFFFFASVLLLCLVCCVCRDVILCDGGSACSEDNGVVGVVSKITVMQVTEIVVFVSCSSTVPHYTVGFLTHSVILPDDPMCATYAKGVWTS